MCLDPCHTKPPADKTTIAVSVCSRCGAIEKSGKISCCGRGGSWFRNCGSVGNTKLHHTWYEGIQACKARTQQPVVARQKETGSSQGDDMINYKVVITATKTVPFTSGSISADKKSMITSTYTPYNTPISLSVHTLMVNTPSNTLITPSTHTSVSTSITTHGLEILFKITVHINLLFIIVF